LLPIYCFLKPNVLGLHHHHQEIVFKELFMLQLFRVLFLSLSISLVSIQSKAILSTYYNHSPQNDSDKEYLSTRLDSLEIYKRHKNWEGIIDLSYKLENFAEISNNRDLLFQMIMLRASSLQSLGNFNLALTCYLRLLDIYEHDRDSVGLVSTLNSIGKVYTDMGNLALALKHLYRGIYIAEKTNDFYNQAFLYHSASIAHYFQNDMERCEFCLQEAESRLTLKQINELRPSIQDVRGLLLAEQKKYNQAQKQFTLSLAGHKKTGDSLSIANTYDNLGQLSRYNGRYDESIDYHYQSLRIKTKFRNFKSLAISYHHLAETFFRIGNKDSPLFYADKSMLL